MTEKKKIVRTLYRVSTTKQLDKDDIPMQRFACKNFLKDKEGWDYDETNSYVEKGVSGFKKSSKERDVLQTLMNDAKNGDFDVLLVYMFDRIGRQEYDTPFILKTLDNFGIELWSVEEGRQQFKDHSDDLINFIRFWQASGESKKTSLRVRESLKQKILDGKFTGGIAPYGYKLIKSGEFNKKGKELMMLVRNHEEAKIVALIYLLSNKKGYGGNRIAKYLNENDIKTRNGYYWRATTVDYVLRNPVYKGYLVSSRTSLDNHGKAKTNNRNEWVQSREKIVELEIIVESIWEEVQNQRNARNYKKNGDKIRNLSVTTKSPLLLTGMRLISCGYCGSPLTTTYNTKSYTKKNGEVVKTRSPKYRCSGKAHKMTKCAGQTIYSQNKIESVFLHEISKFIEGFREEDLQKRIKSSIKKIEKKSDVELKNLKRKLAKYKKELEVLHDEVVKSLTGDSNFTPELLNELMGKKETTIKEIEKQIKELEKELQREKDEVGQIEKIKSFIPNWRNEFENLDLPEKKIAISKIIRQVTVYREEIKIDFNFNVKEFIDSIKINKKVDRVS